MMTSSTGRRGKGWTRDRGDGLSLVTVPRHSTLAHFGAVHGRGLPGSHDLLAHCADVWDQDYTSSCVAQADMKAVEIRCSAIGRHIKKPSATAGYVSALAIERKLNGISVDVPLVDNGSQPSLMIAALCTVGIPDDADWPPGGFDPARIVEEGPDLAAELEKASKFKLQGWHPIEATGGSLLAQVRQAIANDCPVPFGTEVDDAFESYAGEGVLGAPDAKNLDGGHMMCIVGYRDDGDFLVMNSWGPGWGMKGFFWCKPSFLDNEYAADFSVISVTA